MAESIEDLEPLFNYSRVRPFDVTCLDDDDDSPPFPTKRRKVPLPSPPKLSEVHKEKAVITVNIDEDDDWLPPPPPSLASVNAHKLGEDPTLAKLRLKKQELLSIAESTPNVLQAMQERAEIELSDSLETSVSKVEETSKPSSDREKMVISIQDKEGKKQFRVYKDDKLERLFKMYADKVKVDLQKLVFCFDGDKISPTATPLVLEMEDKDIIEVHFKAR